MLVFIFCPLNSQIFKKLLNVLLFIVDIKRGWLKETEIKTEPNCDRDRIKVWTEYCAKNRTMTETVEPYLFNLIKIPCHAQLPRKNGMPSKKIEPSNHSTKIPSTLIPDIIVSKIELLMFYAPRSRQSKSFSGIYHHSPSMN